MNHLSILYPLKHVAKIVFNRPQQLNALSFEMAEQLINLNEKLKPSTRAVIFTGTGKSFSTGRDLKLSKRFNKEQQEQYLESCINSVKAVSKLKIPTIAAINGYAFGWGLEVSLACDIRVVNTEAILCFPETGLGLFPGAGGAVLLPRLIGSSAAKELIYTAKRFTGTEAHSFGLATRTAPDAEASVESALSLAEKISKNSPLALQQAKHVIDEGVQLSLEEHWALSLEKRSPLNEKRDYQEGLKAFAEKRKPVFENI
eukprot:snap_masked-scaffold_7-processed-gene-0.21-mRNA-1 protein AED:0.02 eAED:0.02 QI:0/-1/0/1/-1/1/1/0/257